MVCRLVGAVADRRRRRPTQIIYQYINISISGLCDILICAVDSQERGELRGWRGEVPRGVVVKKDFNGDRLFAETCGSCHSSLWEYSSCELGIQTVSLFADSRYCLVV